MAFLVPCVKVFGQEPRVGGEIYGLFMHSDYSISCDTGQHKAYLGVAIFMFLALPLGFPCFFFFYLRWLKNHRRLWIQVPRRVVPTGAMSALSATDRFVFAVFAAPASVPAPAPRSASLTEPPCHASRRRLRASTGAQEHRGRHVLRRDLGVVCSRRGCREQFRLPLFDVRCPTSHLRGLLTSGSPACVQTCPTLAHHHNGHVLCIVAGVSLASMPRDCGVCGLSATARGASHLNTRYVCCRGMRCESTPHLRGTPPVMCLCDLRRTEFLVVGSEGAAQEIALHRAHSARG